MCDLYVKSKTFSSHYKRHFNLNCEKEVYFIFKCVKPETKRISVNPLWQSSGKYQLYSIFRVFDIESMSVTLNLMLLLTVAAGFLEADESESKQEQCFDQQINEIKAQRKEEMAFFRQAFATLDQKFEEMKLMFLQSTAKADNPFKYSLATTGQNKRTSKSRARRGVEDVGAVFVTLHDKALQTSSDVQRLLGATGELEEALQNISNDCSAIPFMLDEIKAIRKNQEFFKRPGSCLDLLNTGHTLSGPYTIYAGSSQKEIEVS